MCPFVRSECHEAIGWYAIVDCDSRQPSKDTHDLIDLGEEISNDPGENDGDECGYVVELV